MINMEDILNALKEKFNEATALLDDTERVESLLQKLEKKLETIPVVGEGLSVVPVMASLVRNYMRKEYTNIPKSSIVAIVATFIYLLSPIDLIPDSLGPIGYADDALVVAACWKMVGSDVRAYEQWRDEHLNMLRK